MIRSETKRVIKVNEGGEAITMAMARAIMRALCVAAVKGQVRAQKLFFEMATQAEKEHLQAYNEAAEMFLEYKYYWQKELHRLAEAGEELPDLPLDPDYIYIVPQTGVVRILDPENSLRDEDILLLDDLRDHRKYLQNRSFDLRDERDATDDTEVTEQLNQRLDEYRGYLAKTDAAIAKLKEVLG